MRARSFAAVSVGCAALLSGLAGPGCAGLLGLDPGTLGEAGADGGPDADDAAGLADAEAGGPRRRCAEPVAPGIYCDDFDEPWRTGPGGREATPFDGELTLVTVPSRSSPRALRAAFSTGRSVLRLARDVPNEALRVTLAVYVPKGNAKGKMRIASVTRSAAQLEHHIVLDVGESDAVLSLGTGGGGTVLTMPRRLTYEAWHDVTLRFSGRSVFLQLDDLVAQGATAPIDAVPVEIFFGLDAFGPAVVVLDDVEISTLRE